MFEDIFFAIVYGIMGLTHDKKYGGLTIIAIVVVLLIIIGKIVY